MIGHKTSQRVHGALLAALVVCFPAVAIAAGEGAIAIGPYVQNVSTESAVICWATVAGESKVTGPDGKTEILRDYSHHEVELPDLEPNTTYHVDVLGTGDPEGKASFTTFFEGIKPFRFVALGDTRSGHDTHAKIVNRVIEEEPLFVINSGDLVSEGRNISHWETFFEINDQLMRSIPYFPVLGNHENDSPLYYDFFSLPGNERYYMFSVGDALFLMLDFEGHYHPTPDFMSDKEREVWWHEENRAYFEQEKAWLEHRLEFTKSAGFVFAVFHEPLYSAKASRVEDAAARRAFWGDIFERYGVQVVLTGNDHHYHRAVHGGTHYVTTAGGGAGLYDIDAPQPESVIWKKVHHYMVIDIGLEEATLKAIEVDGNEIESFTIKRRSW